MISNLYDVVSNAAHKRPDGIAVIEAGQKGHFITYRELDARIKTLSNYMLQKGLQKGERVGILFRNSIMYVASFFAISRAGGVIVLFNHTLEPSRIIEEANDCTLSAICIGENLRKKGEEVLKRTRSIRFVVDGTEASLKKTSFPRVLKNDLAAIVYTSGTTSKPLGVMLSHKNLISNNTSIAKYTRIGPSDRACCVLPFYYIYGLSLLLSHFLAGATVIIDNRFMYPSVVLDSIERYKATGFAGVSSHYVILLDRTDFKKRRLPNLKYFLQAGDKMPSRITKELLNIFPRKRLYIMYGQTEASPRLTYLKPDLVGKKPDSIGSPIPGVRMKIVNEDGRECKTGERGEIIAKGDNIMLGYWNNEEETKRVIKKGWLHTGDIAFKDKDGDIFIVGRKRNFIKVGGHRINPLEIEELVMQDERIVEAAAVAEPDAILGNRINLFVSIAQGVTIDKSEIIGLCKENIAPYKIPSEVVILDSIPKNSYGKMDREALKTK